MSEITAGPDRCTTPVCPHPLDAAPEAQPAAREWWDGGGPVEETLRRASEAASRGEAAYQRHEIGEADALFRMALDLRERALGVEHHTLVPTLTRLVALCVARGDLGAAEPLLKRALQLSEQHLGDQHADIAIFLDNLARLYLRRGAAALAEPLLLRLLALREAQAPNHPEVAVVLASLARARQALGKYAEAEELWRRVLAIQERSLAPFAPALMATLENLAATCAAGGRTSEALALRERALTIAERTLGPEHPTVAAERAKIVGLQLELSGEDAPPAPAPVWLARGLAAQVVEAPPVVSPAEGDTPAEPVAMAGSRSDEELGEGVGPIEPEVEWSDEPIPTRGGAAEAPTAAAAEEPAVRFGTPDSLSVCEEAFVADDAAADVPVSRPAEASPTAAAVLGVSAPIVLVSEVPADDEGFDADYDEPGWSQPPAARLSALLRRRPSRRTSVAAGAAVATLALVFVFLARGRGESQAAAAGVSVGAAERNAAPALSGGPMPAERRSARELVTQPAATAGRDAADAAGAGEGSSAPARRAAKPAPGASAPSASAPTAPSVVILDVGGVTRSIDSSSKALGDAVTRIDTPKPPAFERTLRVGIPR